MKGKERTGKNTPEEATETVRNQRDALPSVTWGGGRGKPRRGSTNASISRFE